MCRKIISALLFAVMVINLIACGAAKDTITEAEETIKETADSVAEIASQSADEVKALAGKGADEMTNFANEAAENIKKTIDGLSFQDFEDGWEFASEFFGATAAALGGESYVKSVGSQIEHLEKRINTRAEQYYNNPTGSIAGFVAEEWHAGTYNIDAVARGLKPLADTPKSNRVGSADITTRETSASVKYWDDYTKNAKEQAKSILEKAKSYKGDMTEEEWIKKYFNLDVADDNPELFWSIYKDQVRIIPADQIEDARTFLEKAIAKEAAKEGPNREYVMKNYQETLDRLSDRLETEDGTKSIPLDKDEAEAIAALAKEGNYKPSEYSKNAITIESAIRSSYVSKQAIKAGATAAVLESALTLGPEVYEIIKKLIDEGKLDKEQLKSTGLDGLSSAADGFLKGSVSNALVVMCQAGKLGAEYVSASPELIGAMTVIVIDGIRYGIKLADGNLTTLEYVDIMAEELVVSVGALGAGAMVGMLLPGATLAICVGSMVGGLIVSCGYTHGKSYVLAVIEASGVDVMLPVPKDSEIIKEKTEELKIRLSDVVSSIKSRGLNGLKLVTIKVYDLTSNISLEAA